VDRKILMAFRSQLFVIGYGMNTRAGGNVSQHFCGSSQGRCLTALDYVSVVENEFRRGGARKLRCASKDAEERNPRWLHGRSCDRQ
jgi:hypothetical protein